MFHGLTSFNGSLYYCRSDGAFAAPHWDFKSQSTKHHGAGVLAYGRDMPTVFGFAIRTPHFQLPFVSGGWPSRDINVIVPYWLLIFVFAIIFSPYIVWVWTHKREHGFEVIV